MQVWRGVRPGVLTHGYTRPIRSRVAEETCTAHEARIRAMTAEQRLALAEKLRERGIADFMAATGLSREEALRRIRQWIGATHTIAYRAPDPSGRITLFAQPFTPGADTTAARRELLPADADAVAETFAIAPDGTRAVLSVIDEASGLMIAEF